MGISLHLVKYSSFGENILNMLSNQSFKIFIVEDDVFYSKILQHHLSSNPDYEVKIFHTAKDCIKNLDESPSVVTIDYNLPDMTGDELFKKVKSTSPATRSIIISAQEDVSTAINILKLGAYDYIVKNDETKNRLWATVNNIRKNVDLEEQLEHLREEIVNKYDFEKQIIGKSDVVKNVFALMEKATKTNINISINGETGTGKELVAKSIHYNSDRKKRSFVAVNVAAIPRDLIESELFGHEKGSFTGAASRRIGKFEEANKGTLFLDEIGEFDLNLQSKLLRVLQEREITRVGSNETVPIDVRIITATHKNLLEEVRKGNFREDLYYRLIGLPIYLPPLREREKDVLIIGKHFIDQFCRENKIEQKQLTSEAKSKLLSYPFPGNIRELKAIVELAVVMSNNSIIDAADLTISSLNSVQDIFMQEKTLDEYTRNIIQHFLDKYNGNVLMVANKLSIGKSTLYRMLQNKELEIRSRY
jgi:two-component system, NtrC family, response regulator AtoC